MKVKNLSALILVILIFSACKKELLTKPVEFTTTEYEQLGSWDSSGIPTYLLPRDRITTELRNFINGTLIEKGDLRKTSPDLLATSAIADLDITQTSDVTITFVSQKTDDKNTLGFYTYPTSKPITRPEDIATITYIFPSVSGGTRLRAGDKVKIGTFQPGTSIGFVLLKNAWKPATAVVNNKAVHFCSNDVLNPEVDPSLKKHAVLVNYPAENKMLIGFENTNRTEPKCDHDFNDVVIYATIIN